MELKECTKIKKIFCIGSNTTDQTKNFPHPYQSAKLALENSCNQLFYQGYDITLLKLGWVDTERTLDKNNIIVDKINTDYVADVIDWVLKQKYKIKEITIIP